MVSNLIAVAIDRDSRSRIQRLVLVPSVEAERPSRHAEDYDASDDVKPPLLATGSI